MIENRPSGGIAAVIFLFLLFFSGFPVSACSADDTARPFALSFQREAIFLSAAAVAGAAGSYAVSRVEAPDPASLRKSNVPGIDRVALHLHSKAAGDWSNITAGACVALPVLFAASNLHPGDREASTEALIDLAMFAESSLLNMGLTRAAKGVFHRSRPWAYDTSLSATKRQERDAALSFWSSHSSTAFNAAVFTGYVFQKRHPGSKLVVPVWTVGLSLASATAVLRVRAGQHFPTDVLAGAAAGSLTGWAVPRLHLKSGTRTTIRSSVGNAPGISFALSF